MPGGPQLWNFRNPVPRLTALVILPFEIVEGVAKGPGVAVAVVEVAFDCLQ